MKHALGILLWLFLLGGCGNRGDTPEDSPVVEIEDITYRFAGKSEEWMISTFGEPEDIDEVAYPGLLLFACEPVYKLRPGEKGRGCYYELDGKQLTIFLVKESDQPWRVICEIWVPEGTVY